VAAIFRDQDKFSTTAFDDQTVFAIKVGGGQARGGITKTPA